jgi:hypothetical protein
MNIKQPTLNILKILATIAVIIIYFQLYWHYWFVKLLGGYIVNTLLPIMLLLFLFIISNFVSHSTSGVNKREIFYLLILFFWYFFLASVSIFLNEQGFESIKSYLIYIYSPVLIFISILGLYVYRQNENIKFTLNVLLILGVIFSIYVAITYSGDPLSVSEIPILETNRGDVYADTGASFGIGDLSAKRYTIPGISSTTYGPLLVPLIFVGLYFRKHSGRKLRYFYSCAILFLTFCVFKTVSRGPLISLIAGMIYLTWLKWFKLREIMLITFILIISFFTFAKLSFLRLVITFVAFTHIDLPFLGEDVSDLLEDPRLISIKETLSYIYQNPFWGMGMSHLINVQEFLYGKEHNNYLSIAASFGIPTLIFYLLFVFLLFIMMHEKIKNISRNSLAKDMGIILGAGLLALVVYLNFAPAEFHFIWIWFGLAAAWLRNCEDEFLLRKPAISKLCSEKI